MRVWCVCMRVRGVCEIYTHTCICSILKFLFVETYSHTYIHMYLQSFLNVYTRGNTVHSCSFCLAIFTQRARTGGAVPDTSPGCAHEAPDDFFCVEDFGFRPLVRRDGYAPPTPHPSTPLLSFLRSLFPSLSLLSLVSLSYLRLDLACRVSISRFLFL